MTLITTPFPATLVVETYQTHAERRALLRLTADVRGVMTLDLGSRAAANRVS